MLYFGRGIHHKAPTHTIVLAYTYTHTGEAIVDI